MTKECRVNRDCRFAFVWGIEARVGITSIRVSFRLDSGYTHPTEGNSVGGDVADTNWEFERVRYHNNVRSLKPRKKRGVLKADGNPGVVIAFAPLSEQPRIRTALLRSGNAILASGSDESGQFFTIVVRTTDLSRVVTIVNTSP
jgi:hypothetical protein